MHPIIGTVRLLAPYATTVSLVKEYLEKEITQSSISYNGDNNHMRVIGEMCTVLLGCDGNRSGYSKAQREVLLVYVSLAYMYTTVSMGTFKEHYCTTYIYCSTYIIP